MKKIFAIPLICLFVVQYAHGAGMWITLDAPGAMETYIYGISGSNLIGQYVDGSGTSLHGFLYDGSTWTTLDVPGVVSAYTEPTGIDGNNIVGFYGFMNGGSSHGFLYNITKKTWVTLDAPGSDSTKIYGIQGNNIVGYRIDGYVNSGFVYNGTSWSTLNMPNAYGTLIKSVDGNNLVGNYVDTHIPYMHGFFYNGTDWTTLDAPGVNPGLNNTRVFGIAGNNLVGWYEGFKTGSSCYFHGFLYNGTTWIVLDEPGATFGTYVRGIHGSKLVGYYQDEPGHCHGFVYEIPRQIACIVGGNKTIEAQGPHGANVTLDGSCSSDADSTPGTNDDINDFNWYRLDPCNPDNKTLLGKGEIIDCNLPLGKHTIVLEVTDKAGATDSNEITVTVQDTTPPKFCLLVWPRILWPANHKMVKVTPIWYVKDACDPKPKVSLVSVTSNDKDMTKNDIEIKKNGTIYLRAEKGKKVRDRVYSITYKACDYSGNCTVKTATVIVPHDNRK